VSETIRYIISFLLYGNEQAIERICYAPSYDSQSSAQVTILGNGIEGELHLPDMQQPEVERLENGHYIIHTDLIYNTFFFISRAEELIHPQRDQYGRFLAQYSMLGTNDLQIPLIDEYSRILLKLLDLPLPQPGFSAVHLTHDIDTLTQYRHLRGAIGGIWRGEWRQVKEAMCDIHRDPAYTFPWLIQQDAECTMHNAECIYFVKLTDGKGLDYPQYHLLGRDWRNTKKLLADSGARFGVHSSAYATTALPAPAPHRSHYLCCSIERMQQLVDAGYTDDYTMGFADKVGFRLQTTRAVRWIHPYTRQLTPLTLHPLTLMDATMSNTNYMNLNEDEAYFVAQEMIDKVRMHHGELNLLWHNTSINAHSYHKSLYPKILQLL